MEHSEALTFRTSATVCAEGCPHTYLMMLFMMMMLLIMMMLFIMLFIMMLFIMMLFIMHICAMGCAGVAIIREGEDGDDSRRRDCHFDDTPCLSLLKNLAKVQGGCHQMTVWPRARRRAVHHQVRSGGRDQGGLTSGGRATDSRVVLVRPSKYGLPQPPSRAKNGPDHLGLESKYVPFRLVLMRPSEYSSDRVVHMPRQPFQ